MNFLAILKRIFPSQPTLEEFINSHNPETVHDVEYLEKQYERLVASSAFMTQGTVR